MPRFFLLIASLITVSSLAVKPTRAAPPSSRELPARLAELLDDHPAARRTTIALKVVDLADQQVLFDREGDRLFVPASNLKIYTSACALDVLGPERRMSTRVVARGALVDGILDGDVIIVGGGDAMLTSADLDKIATWAVREWKLKVLRGRVLVDNSRYASPLKGPGWMWDDDPDYYNMSVTPLMIDFNVLTVRVNPAQGKLLPLAELAPPSDSPPLQVRVDAGATETTISRRPFTETILVNVPEIGDKATTKTLTMHDPGPWAAGLFAQMLRARGVHIEAPAADSSVGEVPDQPAGAEFIHDGGTLLTAINHFHDKSENAVGEVLLHEIAIARGFDRPRWADGAAEITRWLENTAGLEPGSFRIVDGSGLSRYNLISADSAVRLLSFMHKHRHDRDFFDSLPRYKLDNATDADRDVVIAAKTGGMQSVATISGYLKTRGGRLLAFSLLANGYVGSNASLLELRQQVWRTLVDSVD